MSTRAWAKGAEGERRVGRGLDSIAGPGIVVLHDRRIPRSSANIDHLVVASNGVHVIDAKRYRGLVERRPTGGILRPGPARLFVAGRDRSALVVAMARQVAAVSSAVGELLVGTGTTIRPTLCFIDSEWGLFTKAFAIDGVTVTWPKALHEQVRRPGPLGVDLVTTVAARLAERLTPA